MDCQYLEIGGESQDEQFTDFDVSLTVVATVLNTYFEKALTTDAGAKALTLNTPGPLVVGEPGFVYNPSSDEFGMITYETAGRSYAVGDKIEVIPSHCDPVVNLYDQIYATRGGQVEAVWPISARGPAE
jgi:3-hydroxy-D-aspartate aldolase